MRREDRVKIPAVYSITNTITGVIYIGSTYDVVDRVRHHFYALKSNTHHNKRLQHSYNLHGKDCFDWDILQQCLITPWVAEQEWLDDMRPIFDLYNTDPTAATAFRETISFRVRKKISRSLTGRKRHPSVGRKISMALTGIPLTEERKRNISLARIKPFTETEISEIQSRLASGEKTGTICRQMKIGLLRLCRLLESWK